MISKPCRDTMRQPLTFDKITESLDVLRDRSQKLKDECDQASGQLRGKQAALKQLAKDLESMTNDLTNIMDGLDKLTSTKLTVKQLCNLHELYEHITEHTRHFCYDTGATAISIPNKTLFDIESECLDVFRNEQAKKQAKEEPKATRKLQWEEGDDNRWYLILYVVTKSEIKARHSIAVIESNYLYCKLRLGDQYIGEFNSLNLAKTVAEKLVKLQD